MITSRWLRREAITNGYDTRLAANVGHLSTLSSYVEYPQYITRPTPLGKDLIQGVSFQSLHGSVVKGKKVSTPGTQ